MSTFKSWSKLFVLVLLVFALTGCGGGGGSSTSGTTSDMPGWDTDTNHNNSTPAPTTPEPTTPDPAEPEPTTPELEPTTPTPVTPEPNTPEPVTPEPEPSTPAPTQPEPSTEGTYTDTYDIASVLEGAWNGISGSGMTINTPIIGLLMSQISINFTRPQMLGDIGTTYITQQQYWNYTDGVQTYQEQLGGNNVQNNITHIGADTWQLDALDSTTIINLTSESTAEVTQEGVVTRNDYIWQYRIYYTLHKESNYNTSALYGNWELATPYNAGLGTATYGTGSNYDLLELNVSSAKLSFSEAGSSNVNITHNVNFGAYRSGIYTNSASPTCPKQSVSVQQLEKNIFKYTLNGFDPNIGGTSSASSVTVQIKLTSDVTAEVTETGHFRLSKRLYTYNVFYKLTKQ